MTTKPLEENEKGIETFGCISSNVRISIHLSQLCHDFHKYLNETNKDIKVWQNTDGDCLLLIDDKAVVCNIDIISTEPPTDLDEFFMEQLRWYKEFFTSHRYVRYISMKELVGISKTE